MTQQPADPTPPAPDKTAIIAARSERLKKLRADPRLLQASRIVYSASPADFIDDWVWTYDPRVLESPAMPLVMWPRQRDYILWLLARLETRTDGLVLKSRDMGLTWLCCAFAVWAWLFKPGIKISFGSRKELLVDEIGNMDSIFQKMRFILDYVPKDFLPAGFNPKSDMPFCKIINGNGGASITGEAGDNIGRGGRSTLYFKDEAAFLERPEMIDAALSENSDCKIDVSTPHGIGNPFHKKFLSFPDERKFVFDWRDDPRKDQAWYERKKQELEPWILAQEIDHDFSASLEGVCIPSAWIQAAVGFPLDSSGARVAGLDVADEGADKSALAIRKGPVVEHIEEWREGSVTQTARKAWRICLDRGAQALCFDSIGVGAGVRGECESLAGQGGALVAVGVAASESPSEGLWEPGRTCKDMFANLKAELWWAMRRRLQRTWERAGGLGDWPDEECVSLPNDQQLIQELGQPLYFVNSAGKIIIESKKDMKRRGIPSPNKADALLLAFAPARFSESGRRLGKRAMTRGAVG